MISLSGKYMKNLKQWLEHIESFHPEEIELGLERISDVASTMGLLEQSSKIILVGGTNGKGSCVATIESLARCYNKTYGSYTSPHLVRFNERIKINGQEVCDSQLTDAFESIESCRKNTTLTFFEFTTLAALFIFKQTSLDLIILEVGLGGRLDAVNIIDPDVSVITTIDKDHESWLGDNLTDIAHEKSGIYRNNAINIVGDKRSFSLLKFQKHLSGLEIDLARVFCQKFVNEAEIEMVVNSRIHNPNRLLKQNIECGIAAFINVFSDSEIKPIVENRNIEFGKEFNIASIISNIEIAGRFHQVMDSPVTIVDVGHNSQAARNLVQQISGLERISTRVIICGMMNDKAIADYLTILDVVADHWIFVDLPGPRAAKAVQLRDIHQQKKLKSFVSIESSVAAAHRTAVGLEQGNVQIFVLGSFITVSEMLLYLPNNC